MKPKLFPSATSGDKSRRLLLFTLLNFMAVGGVVIGSTVSTAMFLKEFGAGLLPLSFMVVAALTIVCSNIMTGLERKHLPEILMHNSALILASIVIALWASIRLSGPAVARPCMFALFVFVELAAFVVFFHLWNLAARYFGSSDSKASFPTIAAGGSIGGVIGGGFVSIASGVFQPTDILLGWSGLLLASAPIILLIRRHCEAVHSWQPERGTRRSTSVSAWRTLMLRARSFWGNRFIRNLTITFFLATILTYTLDYLSNYVLSERFDSPESMASFLGLFTCCCFVTNILIQLAFLSRIVTRLGLANCSLIFPFATVTASAYLMLAPALFAGIIGLFTRRYFKGSFFTVVVDLLLNALHPREKPRIRGILKGVVCSIATVLASVGIFALQQSVGYKGVAVFSTVVAVFYIFYAWLLRNSYTRHLKLEMARGRGTFAANHSLHSANLNVIMDESHMLQALKTADDDVTIMMLQTADDSYPERVREHLRGMYAERSLKVRTAIIPPLARSGERVDADFLLEQFNREQQEAREVILRHGQEFTTPQLSEASLSLVGNPAEPVAVRAAALAHLCAAQVQFFSYRGHLTLASYKDSDDSDEFAVALQAAGALGNRRILGEFIPHIAAKNAVTPWMAIMDRLEDGSDDSFADAYCETFASGNRNQRRLSLQLLRRISCRTVYERMWAEIERCSDIERAAILEIGREQDLLSARQVSEVLGNSRLSELLFRAAAQCWMVRRDQEQELGQRIRAQLWEQLRVQISDCVVAKSLGDETTLLAWSLEERSRETVVKLIAWELAQEVETAEFETLLEHILSDKQDEVEQALETLANMRASLKSSISELLDLRDQPNEWPNRRQEWGGPDESASAYGQRLLTGPDVWISAACLYSFRAVDAAQLTLTDPALAEHRAHRYFKEAMILYEKPTERKMLSTFEKLLLLRNVPFFSELSSEDLRRISDICEEVFFTAGDVIIRKGEVGHELFIMEHGKVRVGVADASIELEPPAHFGEMAIFTKGLRTATIVAVQDTNTLAIKSDKFRQLIMEFPHIVFPIVGIMMERIDPNVTANMVLGSN